MRSLRRTIARWTVWITALSLLTACGTQSGGSSQGGTSGTIVNKGSDTMVNLALAWAETYQADHPEVVISVTGGGSGTGIAALINGTVDIANASRQIKPEEIAEAQANGIEPIEVVVARDAIAVVVHRDNPIERLSIDQISAIYSGAITNWADVGGEDRPIVRLSRETNSGTHVYFLEEVLRKGEKDNKTLFATDTLLLPSSEGIAAEIVYNENAIGYDGLGYVTDEMKVIAVSKSPDGPFILPSADSVNSGAYPIARDLYMYTAGVASSRAQAYLDWILDPEGQAIVTQLGFVPLMPGDSP
jgi:phosphate transport system substrate-binding protein